MKHTCILPLSEIANFSMKYFILSNVYTDEGGKNGFTTVCPPAREMINLSSWIIFIIQADKPCITITWQIHCNRCAILYIKLIKYRLK